MNNTEMKAIEDRRLARLTTTELANHRKIVAEVKAARPSPFAGLDGIRFAVPAERFKLPEPQRYEVMGSAITCNYATYSKTFDVGEHVPVFDLGPDNIKQLLDMDLIRPVV